MPIFRINDRTVLFIHIPKTGGTTIENWLMSKGEVSFLAPNRPATFGCCPQHFTCADFLYLFGRKSWDYAFAMVRDPYERMESEYSFFAEMQAKRFGVPPNFSVWVQEQLSACAKNPLHRDNHIRRQLDFVDEGMDIFKYEAGFESITERVSRAAGIGGFSTHQSMNASARAPVSWTSQALEAFNQFYEADLVRFGYPMRTAKLNIVESDSSVAGQR